MDRIVNREIYLVYILKCADNTLYTGMTKDIKRRLHEHSFSASKGAKYVKSRRPCELVYQEICADRSAAAKREIQIKKMARNKKIMLIKNQNMLTDSLASV